MSFKYEIKVSGDEKWYSNSVVFATANEANEAGKDKYMCWSLAEAYRVVETDETPNYLWGGVAEGVVPLFIPKNVKLVGDMHLEA